MLCEQGSKHSLDQDTTRGQVKTTVSKVEPFPVLTIPVQLKRSGIETKLVLPAGPPPLVHQRSAKALQEGLLKALQWNEALLSGAVNSIDALTRRENVDPSYARRVRKLAFLAPDIMEAIINGQVPDTLTLETLNRGIPLDWQAQRQQFKI